jgi:hypothetical protein
MFNIDKECRMPHMRPLYGAFNIYQDPRGAASHWGDHAISIS